MEANKELKYSALSLAQSAVMPFEVSEEMEVEQTPKKDSQGTTMFRRKVSW